MADRIRFAVSVSPIETLTTEDLTLIDVLASEIKTNLSGGGDSVELNGYEDAALNQGYLNGVPYYIDAVHTAGGAQCVSGIKNFVFIKNTGRFFSTNSILGDVSTHAVSVVIRLEAYGNGVQCGWTSDGTGAGEVHFIEIAYLKSGQAIILPVGSGITQFGINANDFSPLGTNSQYGASRIYVKTVAAPVGGIPAKGNAVEFLAVD